MSELDDLQRMLKASEGKSGTAARIVKIKERIAEVQAQPEPEVPLPPSITKPAVRYRSSVTGGYVSAAYAAKHPDITIKETGS